MESTSPTRFYAFAFAVVAGTLLAMGHIVASCILIVAAVASAWAWITRDDDERGLY